VFEVKRREWGYFLVKCRRVSANSDEALVRVEVAFGQERDELLQEARPSVPWLWCTSDMKAVLDQLSRVFIHSVLN
jgi:hypothetical protein